MRLRIVHTTTYHYSQPARESINELRLTPLQSEWQECEQTAIRVKPGTTLRESHDFFGNLVHAFTVEEAHRDLVVEAQSTVETSSWPHFVYRAYKTPLEGVSAFQQADGGLHDYLVESPYVLRDPETWREALDIQASCPPTWGDLLARMRNHIFDTCVYREQVVHAMRTSTEVQRERVGTCQDFAHLMIAYLRLLNFPARYCSGYLYDPGLDGRAVPEQIGSGVTHAWVQAFVPGAGWVGIDPTNRCWVDESYVTLAVGRDYRDIVPIQGSLLGGGQERTLEVSVRVSAVK